MAQIKRLRALNHVEDVNLIPKGKPGRPRLADSKETRLTVSLVLLTKCLKALEAGASDARTPSVKNQLTEAARGLAVRIWNTEQKPRAPVTESYRLVMPDGAERLVPTIAAAAALWPCKPASLAVMLARGGGKATAKRWHNGNESLILCERVARNVQGATTVPETEKPRTARKR